MPFLSVPCHQTCAQVLLIAQLDSPQLAFLSFLTTDGRAWAKDVASRMRIAGKSKYVSTNENELFMTSGLPLWLWICAGSTGFYRA
jgi:hypothetical protein